MQLSRFQSIALSKMPSDRRICARFYPRNDACRGKNFFHLFPPFLPSPLPSLRQVLLSFLSLSPSFFRQEEEEKQQEEEEEEEEEEEGKNRQTHFVAGSFVAETESRPDRRANEASIVLSVF